MGAASIAGRIAEIAAERPGSRALWYVGATGEEISLTYSDLDRGSTQIASALAERGVIEGDRVGIELHNSPQLVLSVFAAWKLGATPVPMRWDLPDWELGRLREVVAGKVHLAEDDLRWIDGTTEREVHELPDIVAPRAFGVCSSGSTGLPKVILSNRPGVYDAAFGAPPAEELGRPIPRPQHVLVVAPMYHVSGLHGVFCLLGGDVVVVMEKFDAASVVDVIERHRISTFNCTPTMLKRIADLPGIEGRDLSSIEWISQGAAPMPPYLVHRWAELIGPERLHMVYGMSEGIGRTAIRADEWMEREGSVGRPTRRTEVRILDTEQKDLPPGEIGEVYLRSAAGVSTSVGGAAPLPTTPDGFVSVGDMGCLDEDGYLYLADRRVDMFISGGANIFPAEVEAALVEHPKVADVVVVGLKDDEWGRRVHAIVQPAAWDDPPSFEEIRAYAKARVHPFKVPKSIEIVDEIPRSAATKVNRGELVDARGG